MTPIVPLLTASELAAWLAISRTAAYRITAGRVRIGGSVRWDRAAVLEWLNRQRDDAGITLKLKHIRM